MNVGDFVKCTFSGEWGVVVNSGHPHVVHVSWTSVAVRSGHKYTVRELTVDSRLEAIYPCPSTSEPV